MNRALRPLPALPALALALTLTATTALAGCQDDEEQTYTIGDFVVALQGRTFDLRRSDGTVLLQGIGSPDERGADLLPGPLAWRAATPDVREAVGMYLFLEHAPAWTLPAPGAQVEVVEARDDRLVLALGAAWAVLEPVASRVLRVSWTLHGAPKGTNRLTQSFACRADQRFYGLGARVHGTDHRGEVIPAWVSEQGIGKLRRRNPFDGFPLQGDVHDTYLAVPFVALSEGFGLLLEESRRSLFHLCPNKAADRWAVEAQNDELGYLVIDGPALTDVIERLTAQTGRPRLPPAWAFGPWIDAVHGPDEVKAVAAKLRTEQIPSSAIWTEDWIGGAAKLGGYHLNYQWHADTTLYPDLKGLADGLHAQGFRFLGYFNAFITEGSKQWQEAAAKGYAVKDAAGKALSFIGPLMEHVTLPDLTRADAVAWLQGYFAQAENVGFDGWMADYGEWLPLATRPGDGTTGEESHNLYPVQWQQANRAFWDKARPSGDYVFFVRSGWTGTGGQAPVVWAGDQQTEFSGLDGLASVVPLMVNAGMSGIPIMTHDIGGYSTYGSGVAPTTKELFFRWVELGALSPVMRTHHGAMADKNWTWDHDAETLAHVRRYARLHVALFPYRYGLAREASDKGLPMVRHLALHYPDDPKAAAVKDQFLLGTALLVAPVLVDKARSRSVYLPGSGTTWYDYVTGARLTGGQQHTVKAALDQIPIFAPAGAVIPTLITEVDTLDRVSAAGVKDLDDAERGPLGLQLFWGAAGTSTTLDLYDGARVEVSWQQTPSAAPKVTVGGKALPACPSGAGTPTDCVRADGSRGLTVYTGPASALALGATCAGQACLSLSIKSAPRARSYQIALRW